MKGRKINKKLTFKQAVAATPDVKNGYKAGLQALGTYSTKVKVANKRELEGSLDIDTETLDAYPGGNRWDYAIAYNGEVYFVEVHSAESGQVSKMIRKLDWLQSWLHHKAPEIKKLAAVSKPAHYWIQSGRFAIKPGTPQYRAMIQRKIKPVPQLVLN